MFYSFDKCHLPTPTPIHKPSIDRLQLITMNTDRQVLAERSLTD